MTNRVRFILLLATTAGLASCVIAGWATVTVAVWVRDLPNRIAIDEDAISTTLGAAVTESYHHALRSGDDSIQAQVLTEQFAPAIADNPDAALWVRDEYRDDILSLLSSNNPAVSAAASRVLSMLPLESETEP